MENKFIRAEKVAQELSVSKPYWKCYTAISRKADSNQNGQLRKNLWIENDKKGGIDNEENNI